MIMLASTVPSGPLVDDEPDPPQATLVHDLGERRMGAARRPPAGGKGRGAKLRPVGKLVAELEPERDEVGVAVVARVHW
jgi:hypothetical protein